MPLQPVRRRHGAAAAIVFCVAFLGLLMWLTPAQLPDIEAANNVALISSASEHVQAQKPRMEAMPEASRRIQAFYYAWYGNPETDGAYFHWDHHVLKPDGAPDQTKPAFEPDAGGLGSTFYPMLGPYSSASLAVIDQHMLSLRQAGVGVLSLSWWGRRHSDEQPGKTQFVGFTDRLVPTMLDRAWHADLRVSFHLEPYKGRTAISTREDIAYLIETYGSHPAFFRDPKRGNLPVFFAYDSYLVPTAQWQTVLLTRDPMTNEANPLSIRGTSVDAVVVGLIVHGSELEELRRGGFDGIYTYFAARRFTYGSTPENWPRIAEFCKLHNMLFFPSAGPGYNDERIRPWNRINTREREDGEYYTQMFRSAINVQPHAITITSFNEWHEGTQIEPAVPHEGYPDYGDLGVTGYLQLTAQLASEFS